MASTRAQPPGFPPEKKPEYTVPRTAFAGPYLSNFTKLAQQPLLDLLKHVNCSYLSPFNHRAATLNDLKKHAQALTILIRHLSVSTTYGAIDNANNGGEKFVDGQSFDWLNDLTIPYENDDESHNLPLTSLMNQQLNEEQHASEKEKADAEYVHACPMMRTDVSDKSNQKLLPYATHQLLVEHANAILERLDHEFSAYGGLLGMLPVTGYKKPEEAENPAAQTILGQWIAFTRSLVLRCHDLERSYANALDVVAGEAIVPREILSELGAIGRQPQPLSYAQDRFVLCNVKNGQWEWMNEKLERKEKQATPTSMMYYIEVPTKYYRLKGESTIFVVPQWDGTKATTQLEQRPTVVQVVKPTWGNRASVWEEKHEKELRRLRMYEPEVERLTRENQELREDIEVLAQEKKLYDAERRLWRASTEGGLPRAIDDLMAEKAQLDEERKKLGEQEKDFQKRKEALIDIQVAAEEWIAAEKKKWIEANEPKARPESHSVFYDDSSDEDEDSNEPEKDS